MGTGQHLSTKMFKYTLPSNPLEAGVCSHENPITENALSVSQSCPQQGPPGQPGIPGTPGTPGIPGTMGTLGSSMGCSCCDRQNRGQRLYTAPLRRWKQCSWTFDQGKDGRNSGKVHVSMRMFEQDVYIKLRRNKIIVAYIICLLKIMLNWHSAKFKTSRLR